MNEESEIDIFTYTDIEDLFPLGRADVESLLRKKIKYFDPINVICFSSFWNMVCQTSESKELKEKQEHELKYLLSRNINFPHKKILFNRNTLLHFILSIAFLSILLSVKTTGMAGGGVIGQNHRHGRWWGVGAEAPHR